MRVGVAGRPRGFFTLAARDLLEVSEVEAVTVIDAGSSAGDFKACRVVAGCWGDDASADRYCAEKAISEGADYISTGYSVAAMDALMGMDESARQCGRTVVTSMSWSPGLTNLMAALAKDELGALDEVRISWVVAAAGPFGLPGMLRALNARGRPATRYENGAWHDDFGENGTRRVFFPEPLGWRQVSLCSAPETLSLPRWMPGLSRVEATAGVAEPMLAALVRALPVSGASGNGSVAARATRRVLAAASGMRSNATGWSAARVDATRSQGDPQTVGYGVADQFSNMASGSLLAAVRLLGSGAVSPGVLAPEQAFDPRQFFALLGERGTRLAKLTR